MFLNFKEVFGDDGLEVVTATSTDEEISLSNQWAEEIRIVVIMWVRLSWLEKPENSNWIA